MGGHWSWLIRPFIAIQQSKLRKLGVKIELGKKTEVNAIKALNPDVIMATQQALPKRLAIPGLDQSNVFEAQEVLSGECKVGKTAVIIGGGNIGLEVADYLHRQNVEVTVLESGPRTGSGLEWHARKVLLSRLDQKGIKVLTNVSLRNLAGKKLMCQRSPSNEALEINADSIINALGSEPGEGLAESLKRDFQVVSLPYCERPGEVYRVAQEGAKAARRI